MLNQHCDYCLTLKEMPGLASLCFDILCVRRHKLQDRAVAQLQIKIHYSPMRCYRESLKPACRGVSSLSLGALQVFPSREWKTETLIVRSLLLCFVLSRSGLLHKVMEPKRRPPPEDYPITPPDRERPDPERRLLLQAGRLQRAPWPPHGRQTRPLLLPVQHRLPGRRRAAGWVLGKRLKAFLKTRTPNMSMEKHLYAKSTGIYIWEGFGLNAVDFRKVVLNFWSGRGVTV